MRRLLDAVIDQLPIRVVKSISALQWRSPWLRHLYLSAAQSYVNRDGVIQRGPAKGLRFNAGQARNAGFLLGTYEPEVQRVYAALIKPGMTIYDVGANVGFLSVLAAVLTGPKGRVICFEPLETNIKAINRNAALNSFDNIQVIATALGAKDSVAEFLISEDVGWGRLASARDPAGQNTTRVRVSSLGTAISGHALPLPDLIKIDIEGEETGMLEGSRDVLNRHRPTLLIELHGTNQTVDRILSEVGYSSYVLGERCLITEAPWDAFTISVPSEEDEKCETARVLALAATFKR